MKERGMIFNTGMVRAIIDGRKTETRRPVKFPCLDINMGCELAGNELAGELAAGNYLNSPFGQPGDRIYVRETWGVVSHAFDEDGRIIDWTPDRPATAISEMPYGNGYYSGHVIYSADGAFSWGDDDGYDYGDRSCWKPSIHMPRMASRITLEITDVRVERLCSISDIDALAEGMSSVDMLSGDRLADVFGRVWASIYGEESLRANPWVWVIEFRRVA